MRSSSDCQDMGIFKDNRKNVMYNVLSSEIISMNMGKCEMLAGQANWLRE